MAKRVTDEWDDENDWKVMASQMAPGMAPTGDQGYYLPGMAVPETAAPSVAPTASSGGSRTAWGFTSPTGGRGEQSYIPGTYSGGFDYLEGFDPSKLDLSHPDADSIKYAFARATQGLAPGSESLDEIVRRLQSQGFTNVRRAGPDSIDFGMGEGQMDVIRGGTDATGYHGWQWMPGNGGSDPMAATMAQQQMQVPGATQAAQPVGGSELWDLIMADLQRVAAGQPSQLDMNALARLMGGA
jgi:hypothetical protein